MWHGKGIVIGEYPTDWADAREKAGLMWEPTERPSFITRFQDEFPDGDYPEGTVLGVDGLHAFVPDPDHKMILRDDRFSVLTPSVSNTFSLIKHGRTDGFASMEQIIDTFVGEGAKFETAGSSMSGAYVWALMYLDEPFTLPGDNTEHLPFMALLNNHDGGGACKLVKTSVRVVCWNTWQMASAQGDRNGQQVVFRHTGDVENRIEEAQASMTELRDDMKGYAELAEVMLKLKADDKALDRYLSEFLPNPAENGEAISDRVQANIEGARAAFKHVYLNSVTCEAVTGTAWGLVQASTEYLDHVRAHRSRDTYLGRSILKADPAKAKALGIAAGLFGDGLAKIDSPWTARLVEMGQEEKARSLNAKVLVRS
jgi:phage/plasmid-like protein (TIGR03299 family)